MCDGVLQSFVKEMLYSELLLLTSVTYCSTHTIRIVLWASEDHHFSCFLVVFMAFMVFPSGCLSEGYHPVNVTTPFCFRP